MKKTVISVSMLVPAFSLKHQPNMGFETQSARRRALSFGMFLLCSSNVKDGVPHV